MTDPVLIGRRHGEVVFQVVGQWEDAGRSKAVFEGFDSHTSFDEVVIRVEMAVTLNMSTVDPDTKVTVLDLPQHWISDDK